MKTLKIKPEFKVSYWGRKGKEGITVYIKSAQNLEVKGSRIVYDTGIRLSSSEWQKRTIGAKAKSGKPKYLPAKLVELETKLKTTYRALYAEGHAPTLSDLLERMDGPKRPTGHKIVDWCEDYLTKPYSDGQLKAVTTLKTNIEEFNSSLTFDRLKKPQLKAFFDWLSSKGVANNSQYKRLRALINVAEHADIHVQELTAYSLPYSTTNAMTPRLTWPEVKAVMQTKTNGSIEQTAKDVFLIACFSGLRIDDILNPLQGKFHPAYYDTIQRKTKKSVYVTLHKYNEVLLRKCIGKADYSRQRLSDALDNVLERSGLTEKVTVIRNVGHREVKTTEPKFKFIAFHSGRRFYSRLLNDLGLGGEIDRDELGHSYRNVTELYAGSQQHALRISRVRTAMGQLEKTMDQLSKLMQKVA